MARSLRYGGRAVFLSECGSPAPRDRTAQIPSLACIDQRDSGRHLASAGRHCWGDLTGRDYLRFVRYSLALCALLLRRTVCSVVPSSGCDLRWHARSFRRLGGSGRGLRRSGKVYDDSSRGEARYTLVAPVERQEHSVDTLGNRGREECAPAERAHLRRNIFQDHLDRTASATKYTRDHIRTRMPRAPTLTMVHR